jgi:hypothetical protein
VLSSIATEMGSSYADFRDFSAWARMHCNP